MVFLIATGYHTLKVRASGTSPLRSPDSPPRLILARRTRTRTMRRQGRVGAQVAASQQVGRHGELGAGALAGCPEQGAL